MLENDSETGNEVLVWIAERGSKTQHGNGHSRAFNPRVQASNNKRSPVYYYKKFKTHRPRQMKDPELPFYLAINHKRKPGDEIQYMRGSLGKNEISKLPVNTAKRAGLQGNITNHSERKTCISRLMDAEMPA